MMTRMMIETMSSARSIAENMAMNESCRLRSLMVMVCASRTSKTESIFALMSAPRPGSSTRATIQPIRSRRRSGIDSFMYSQWNRNCERSIDLRAAE